MYTVKILKNKKGEFRVQFCYKKEVLFWSENYTRKPSAMKALESLKANLEKAEVMEVDEVMEAKMAKEAAKKKASKKKAK
jgi:uncharacterized protein YegP (UPF0339 family)